MAARRLGTLAVLVLAMTAGLVACDPPAGSGLTIKATTRTTGLNPGDTVDVRIVGAKANQKLQVFQCAVADCWPLSSKWVNADKNGAVSLRWKVEGTAGAAHWDSTYSAPQVGSCRPPTTCRIYVGPSYDDQVGIAPTSVPLGLTGRQVRFTATPTQDLRGGEGITVTGTAPGAAGRKVRLARIDHYVERRSEETSTKVGASVYVTVRSDGSFSGTYPLPVTGADCSEGQPTRVCEISAWVVKADGSAIDPTFGKPVIGLGFAA